MERLAQEIVLHILSRLPVTSLLQSKLVCRAWRRLIEDPLLFTKHFSYMADSDPSFILQTRWPVPYQIYFVDFFSHNQGEVISKKLPISFMHMYFLVDSCNGLLCLHDSSENIYVYNPFIRFPMELPKLIKYPPRLGLYGFGFLPTTKEYKLVHIYYHRIFRPGGDPQIPASTLEQSEVHVLTIGNPSWRNLEMIPYRFLWQPSQVLVGGRLHWLSDPNRYTRAGQIISFYLTTEKFQEFLPKPDCCGLVRCFHQLVVLRGCLSAAAYHDNDKLEIWVVKEYAVKESWIKEFTIGTYLPTTLRQHDLKLVLNAKDYFPDTFTGVLWILKNGEILLEYMGRELVLYDPRQGTFKELICLEMLKYLKIIAHVVSLIGTDNTVIIS